jgi:ribonuclease HI
MPLLIKNLNVVIYVDGSSRGNPGPAGIGIAIFSEKDLENPIKEISKYIGITTNNVAEYEAVIHALKWIMTSKISYATIKLDSELVYNQIIGKYRVKSARTATQLKRIQILKEQMGALSFKLIRREENKMANRLAQRASRKVKVSKKSFKQEKLME